MSTIDKQADRLLVLQNRLTDDPEMLDFVKSISFNAIQYVAKLRSKKLKKVIKKEYVDDYLDFELGLVDNLKLNPYEETFAIQNTIMRLSPVYNHPKFNTFYKVLNQKGDVIGIITNIGRFGDYQWYPVTKPEDVVLMSTVGIGSKERCLEYLLEYLNNKEKRAKQ